MNKVILIASILHVVERIVVEVLTVWMPWVRRGGWLMTTTTCLILTQTGWNVARFGIKYWCAIKICNSTNTVLINKY